MAYTPDTLQCIFNRTGEVGVSLWLYDTTDATGTVDGAAYFTNVGQGAANPRGMEVGDMMLVRIWTTAVPTGSTTAKNAAVVADAAWHIVITMSSAGAATVATETAIVVAAG